MKHLKIVFAFLVVVVATVFIYSCAKEEKVVDLNQKVNTRSSNSCDPQTLFPSYTGCNSVLKDEQISFTSGNTLYSNGSWLSELCPGLLVDVTYTYTTCMDDNGDPVHFVHDLQYDINEIQNDCPALAEKLAEQFLLNNHTSYLDYIEFEISKQIEFTEAYDEISDDPETYDCGTGSAVYSVKSIANSCYQWGYGVVNYPETGPYYFFTKEDCGTEICCTRSGFYCFEGYTEGIIALTGSSSYDETAFGECSEECTHACGQPGGPLGDI
jgi:hypothetical protein